MTDASRNAADALAAAREACQALIILRTLERLPSGIMHDDLFGFVLAPFGLDDGRDHLLKILDRLERLGLVVKLDSPPRVVVVELTEKGSRVALGGERAESVMRVRPDCPY